MATAAAQSSTAAPPAPVDPTSDPKKMKEVEAARTVIFQLLKGIKQIGMYRHIEAKFPEFLQKAADALTVFVGEHGALTLKVEVDNFTLHKQELFSEESTIPYKFFKDGIRTLIFRPGITVEELVTFTLIALSDPDRGAEDINAQLWKSQLPHFEYIMVEGFRMDEFSEEEVQVEVDKVVDYLQRRLRTASSDYLRFARITEADLEIKLDGVDQMRGVIVTGVTADPSLKAKLQKDIMEEEGARLFPKLISAVFQVVEQGVDDAQLLEDMFIQLLDAMLLTEDFATINQVVLKLRAMEQRAGPESSIAGLLRAFVGKMAEEQRLNRIGESLKYSRPKSPEGIIRYLTGLDPSVVPMLLDIVETIEIAENRTLICDVLVPYAKQHPDPFVNRLRSDKPQMVREMVYVLDRCNHPEKVKFFGQVLASKNLALKLDVMAIIAKGRTGEARKLIAKCLEDDNMQVRVTAARVLPEFDREKALVDLLRLVKADGFSKHEPPEREALYAALGSTGLPGAFAHLQALLAVKPGLFNKQRVIEDKLLAVHGLQGAASIASYKLLAELAEDKAQPPEVVTGARVAAARVKRVLSGGGEK